MNRRERILATILIGFIGLVALGTIGYLVVYLPVANINQEIAELDKDIGEKQIKVLQAQKDLQRLEPTLKRSLPPDPEVARSEYDAVLNRLLRDAKVPATVYTVSPTAPDTRPIPEIGSKKPAYSRVALRITLKPIDLATLIDVLHRYYRLNLLHQITAFTVKKIDGGIAASRRGSTVSDKADLDVTLTTEAIILDGAENRRSLLPIPTAAGAVGGGIAYRALQLVPEPARGLNPQQIARVLASSNRDYSALLVQDMFHGPPPPPRKADPPPTTVVQKEEPKPKEDTSAYIRLTGFGRNSDGTGSAFIQDLAGRLEYEIEVNLVKGKLTPRVEKFYYTKNNRKSFGAETELDISEETSGTRRLFQVAGLDSDAIILTERVIEAFVTVPPPATPRPFGAPGGGGFPNGGFPGGGGFDEFGGGDFAPIPPPQPRGSSRGPKVPPATAVVGGAGYVLPQLKVFAWKHGDALNKIQELTGDEAKKTLNRVQSVNSDPITSLTGQ